MRHSQARSNHNHTPNRQAPQPGTPRPNQAKVQTTTSKSSSKKPSGTILDKGPHSADHTPKVNKIPKLPNDQQDGSDQNNWNSLHTQSDNLPDFLIWVKNEPFDFGILSPLPCQKIGINVLRKIAVYCKEKWPYQRSELTLSQWNHICKYKIQLPSDLMTAYFRLFVVLTRPVSAWTLTSVDDEVNLPAQKHQKKERLTVNEDCEFDDTWDIKFNLAVQSQADDSFDQFTVDTLQFLLFLYIQHFGRLHKKYVPRSAGDDEPWPTFWKPSVAKSHATTTDSKQSPAHMEGGGSNGNNVSVPEQQHAEFVLANLGDLISFLEILGDPDDTDGRVERGKKVHDGTRDKATEESMSRVNVDVLRALSFILGAASTSLDREFRTLDECLAIEGIALKLNYCESSRTVDKRCLMKWVTINLKINPWGPSSIPIPQARVSAITGISEVQAHKRNRIYWNTQAYPKAWYLVSGIEKQVLLLDSLESMSSIKIHRCMDSYIYIPGVHNMILIQKCHRVTLNLGVATRIVKIMDSSNLTISGVGRLFMVCDVSKSTMHLLTPSPPILSGNRNRKIHVSPYNSTYPNVNVHMKIAGISAKHQKWNKPLEIGADGSPLNKNQSPNCTLLMPDQFKIAFYPFKLTGGGGGGTGTIPGDLPLPYQRRVGDINEAADLAKKEFADKLDSEEDAKVVYQSTLQRFKKWLKESGDHDQIVGLRSLQKSLEQKSLEPLLCSKGHDLSCVSRSVRSFFNTSVSFNGHGQIHSQSTFTKLRTSQSQHVQEDGGVELLITRDKSSFGRKQDA